jgi:predicted nucleotide-binding protein
MAEIQATLAKLAGLSKAIQSTAEELVGRGVMKEPRHHHARGDVGHYFEQTSKQVEALRAAMPELFGELRKIDTEPDTPMATDPPSKMYSRAQMLALARDISQIFEIRANSELAAPAAAAKPRRVFITHGNTEEWRKVQPFIEKDVRIETIELAQQYNGGQTIIEKLIANADRCDSAVIVWTGDDVDDAGVRRARENVMHEIGFFQGRYGRGRVILLHEEGVNVPSNLYGLVYSPFPKGTVEASFHLLQRELTHLYGL